MHCITLSTKRSLMGPQLPNHWEESNFHITPSASYSTVYSTLQAVHQEVGITIPPSPFRSVEAKDWIATLQSTALSPLFVYEALKRCNENTMASLALDNFNHEINHIVQEDCPYDIQRTTPYPTANIVASKNKLERYCFKPLPQFKQGSLVEMCKTLHILGLVVLFNNKNTTQKSETIAQSILYLATGFTVTPSRDQQITKYFIQNDPTIIAQLEILQKSFANSFIRIQWNRLMNEEADMPWGELCALLRSDQPLLSDSYCNTLFSAFSAKPSLLGLNVFRFVKSKWNTPAFETKWINMLKNLLAKDFVCTEGEGDVLLQELVNELLHFRAHKSVKEFITKYLSNQVPVLIFSAHWTSEKHFKTVQILLSIIKEDRIGDFSTPAILEQISNQLHSSQGRTKDTLQQVFDLLKAIQYT